MNKILHIDADLQTPNQIHKDGTNKVSQITDKAQGIAFTQSDDAKKPIYNYDGSFEFAGGSRKYLVGDKKATLPKLGDFTIKLKIHLPNNVSLLDNAVFANMNESEIGAGSPVANFLIRFTTGSTASRKVIRFESTPDGNWANLNVIQGLNTGVEPVDDIYNFLII